MRVVPRFIWIIWAFAGVFDVAACEAGSDINAMCVRQSVGSPRVGERRNGSDVLHSTLERLENRQMLSGAGLVEAVDPVGLRPTPEITVTSRRVSYPRVTQPWDGTLAGRNEGHRVGFAGPLLPRSSGGAFAAFDVTTPGLTLADGSRLPSLIITSDRFLDQDGFVSAGRTVRLANEAANGPGILVIDFSGWSLDARRHDAATLSAARAEAVALVTLLKSTRSDLKVGLYGVAPLTDWSAPKDYLTATRRADDSSWHRSRLAEREAAFTAWQAANDALKPLVSAADFLAPSLEAYKHDVQGWALFADGVLAEARRLGGSQKPVLGVIGREFRETSQHAGTPVPAAFWEQQLAALGRSGDGVILTGGTADAATTDGWGNVTRTFLSRQQNPDGEAARRNGERVILPLRVYSWHDWDIEGVTPMAWAHATKTPDQAADDVIFHARRRPNEPLGVFLRHIGEFGQDFYAHGVRAAVLGDLTTGAAEVWTETFFRRLKEAGVRPDFVILDYEEGFNFWQVENSKVRDILLDPTVRPHLDADLKAVDPHAATRWDAETRRLIVAWSTMAEHRKHDALRHVVVDPLRRYFGPDVPVSNYGDMHPTFDVFDAHGWTSGSMSIGGWSSPPLYLNFPYDGLRYRNLPDKASRAAASQADLVSWARSALAGSDHFAPWVSNPSFHDDTLEVWGDTMRHMRAAGTQTFLWWNPYEVAGPRYREERQYAAALFRELRAMPSERKPLPPVPIDTAGIRTGELFTETPVGRR